MVITFTAVHVHLLHHVHVASIKLLGHGSNPRFVVAFKLLLQNFTPQITNLSFCVAVKLQHYLQVHNNKNNIKKIDGAATSNHSQHSTAQHSTAQHSTAQHSTAQHSTAQHSTAQHSTAHHSTAQHSTAQHSTAQHSTAQHSTAQHSTAQLSSAQHLPNSHITPALDRTAAFRWFKHSMISTTILVLYIASSRDASCMNSLQ
jgi:hypothetical protein